MQTCLITGASGFLGRAVAERMRRDFKVVGLANSASVTGLVQRDLRDARVLKDALDEARPDLVLHIAAYKDPDFCEEHPDEAARLNVEPVRTFRACLPDATRLVFVSTDYVFDGRHPPYSESSERNPVNVYGRTKMQAEDVLKGRANTVILRIPVLVGAGKTLDSSGFITQILEPLHSGRETVLDDVIVRHPLWICDVADASAFLESKRFEGTIHLSGPRGKTRYGWTVEIGQLLGLPTDQLRPSKEVVKRRAERPLDSQLRTDRIRSLGYTSFTDFPQVIREVVATFT